MTNAEKIAYIMARITHWSKRFLLDPKIMIEVREATMEEAAEYSTTEQTISELTKQEELLVSQLERIFMGEALSRNVFKTTSKQKQAKTPLATCHQERAEYWTYEVVVWPRLMELDGKEFKAVADSTIAHEMLHVMLWPLCSYAMSLEQRKDRR